jgi:hypothetical protein
MKNILDIAKEIISHEFPNGFYKTSKINTPKKLILYNSHINKN